MNDTVTILYAVQIGNEDWQEEIITEHADQIEPASAWALANGFDRLRIATIDLSVPPDFTKTINRKRVNQLLRGK